MNVDVAGPAGRLEGLVEGPGDPAFAAIVCHPHPAFGGTMHTHAAYRLAKAVVAQGGTALRFNYRGVGRSAGVYDAGRGEAEDARAVLGWLAAQHPALPLLACGFSFGAWMALLAGGPDPRVSGLLLAGVAVKAQGLEDFRQTGRIRDLPKPVAIVQAGEDTLGPPEEIRGAIDRSVAPRRLAVVPGASHLFVEALPELQREAEAAVAWLRACPGASAPRGGQEGGAP